MTEICYNCGGIDMHVAGCQALLVKTPSPSTAEDEMPPLPRAAKRGDLPRPWEYYTADQMLAYGQECARAAVEKERIERRPRVKLDPELKAALEEAAKTRSTVALLPDGEPVFINYGDQPEDNEHLYCTACGGSGHIDDMKSVAAEDERAAFEAWARRQAAVELSLLPEAVECMGIYRSGHTQWLYDGWLARAALSANAADREAKETAARTLEETGL